MTAAMTVLGALSDRVVIIKTDAGNLELPVKKCSSKNCDMLILALGIGVISGYCTKCDEELKEEVLTKIGRRPKKV